MAIKYNSHIVYVLSIDNGNQYYVGSHNGNREYTELSILHQSGNPLQRETAKNHTWDDYYSRVKLFSVEQYSSEEEALDREEELLEEYFSSLPKEKILNKRNKKNLSRENYTYDHDEAWKEHYSSVMRKPKACSTERMGRAL